MTARVLALVTGLVAIAATTETHAEPALELVLSCPEGLNNPDAPDSPDGQVDVGDCSAPATCSCKVYYANRSNQDLTNVVIHIRGEHTPDVRFADPVFEPDGSLAQSYLRRNIIFDRTNESFFGRIDNGWTNASRRGVLGRLQTTSAGVVAGSYLRAPEVWSWAGGNVSTEAGFDLVIPSIGFGTENSFSFTFWSSYEVGAAPVVGKILAIAEVPSSPLLEMPPAQAAPISVVRMTRVLSAPRNRSALTASARFPGTADVVPEGFGLASEVVFDLYLPYWDGTQVRADKDYNPALGHSLLFDPLQGTVTGTASCAGWGAEYCDPVQIVTVMTNGVDAPASGVNAGHVVTYAPGTNHISFRPGVIGHYWSHRLEYALAPTAANDARVRTPGTVPNGLWCASANIPGSTEHCAPSQLIVQGLPDANSGMIAHYIVNARNELLGSIGAGLEHQAIHADRIARLLVYPNVASWSTLTPLEDLDLVSQLPGDSARRMNLTTAGLSYSGGTLPTLAAYDIQVHLGLPSYGHEADLRQRTPPPLDDGDWITCVSAAANTFPVCDASALAAAAPGTATEDVAWVRVHFDHVPTTTDGSGGTILLVVDGELVGARGSIDGDTDEPSLYDENDMTTSSVGTLTTLSWHLEGTTYTVERAMHGEYEPRPKATYLVGAWPLGYVAPDQITSTSTASDTYVGSFLDNVGNTPFYTPITFTWDLSEMPSFRFDGAVPAAVSVFARTSGYLASSMNQNVGIPAGFTTDSAWNPTTRQLTVVLRSTSGASVPVKGLLDRTRPAGEIAGFYAFIHGNFDPGPALQKAHLRVQGDYEDLGATKSLDQRNTVLYQITGTKPGMQAIAAASTPIVEHFGDYDLVLQLHNRGYEDDGDVLAGGATGPALATAMYYRVTRDGDFAGDGGVAAVRFEGTDSSDALGVYVSAAESPLRANAANLTVGNGWLHCGSGGACTTGDLAALGLSAASVRWVAFDFGAVEVTDAPPRGSPGDSGPYEARVHLRDDGSDDGVTLFALAEVAASNTASPLVTGASQVEVDADCDATLPGVGFDQPEICDAYDNDCDGLLNEDLTRTVDCAGQCPPTASETCDAAGNWVGSPGCSGPICQPEGECMSAACDGSTCVQTARVGTCDDGDACTDGDACDANGECHGAAIVCDDPAATTCEEATGCDADEGCTYGPKQCDSVVFFGVVRGPGGVEKSIRCRRAADGTLSCRNDNGVLHLFDELVCQ